MISIIDSAIGKRKISKTWTVVLIYILISQPLPSQSGAVAFKVQEKEIMKSEPTPRPLTQALGVTTPAEVEQDHMAISHPDQVPYVRQKRLISLFAYCKGDKSKAADSYLPPCVSVSALAKNLPLKQRLKKQLLPWLRWG